MSEIHLIAPSEIPVIWEKVAAYLEEAAASTHEYESAADMYHSLVSGFTGLMVAVDGMKLLGVLVIQRMEYPHLKVCSVKALAGEDVSSWIEEANSAVYNWAVTHDCQLVQAFGRPGWKKFYKEQGWNMDKVVYSRPVVSNLH